MIDMCIIDIWPVPALFCHLYEMGVSGPFLVVAPLSTIPNWINEFKRFAPKVTKAHVWNINNPFPESVLKNY